MEMGELSQGCSAVVWAGASGAGPDEQLRGKQLIQPIQGKTALSSLKW